MKMKDVIIDGTKCVLGCDTQGIYLDSNYSDLQGRLRGYDWIDEVSYGICHLDITNTAQLELVIPEINECLDTNFSIVRIIKESETSIHDNEIIQDIVFKSNDKELYTIRLCLTKDNEYTDDYIKNREHEFMIKISTIIYWILWNKKIKD